MQEKRAFHFNFPAVRRILVAVFMISFAFSGGYVLGYKGYVDSALAYPKVTISRDLPTEHKDLNFTLFWKVWDTLKDKYYDQSKLIEAQMVYGAIEGMTASLGDPYTSFLPPSTNKVVEEDLSGNFSGVGIQIGFKDKTLAVTAPLPGSPAEKAGILPGDLIVGIKDPLKKLERTTAGISLNEAVQLIRGPANTKVTLVLLREGRDDPFEVDVNRENIDVPSIAMELVGEDKSIAHIKLQKFGAETVDEWNKYAIEILKNPGVKGIIIDVRNNPGGYMQAAINIASDFLQQGTIVVIEDHGNGEKNEYKSDKLGRLRDKKVVMLINGGSASASEILSGAMRDDLNVKLVGDKSFGKGTIQEPLQLDDGAGLHVTIAKWLTPKGTWVHGEGLKPDVEVKNDPDQEGDEQLQEAIKVVQGL